MGNWCIVGTLEKRSGMMYKVISERGVDVLLQNEEGKLKIVRNDNEVVPVHVGIQSLLMRGYWHEPSPETMKKDYTHLLGDSHSGTA